MERISSFFETHTDIIREEFKKIGCLFGKNNNYLFKVTYIANKINLDVCHILTDGVGATIFLKAIIYNYLDMKYSLNREEVDMIMEGKTASEIIKIMEGKDGLAKENPFIKMEKAADLKREELKNAEEKYNDLLNGSGSYSIVEIENSL